MRFYLVDEGSGSVEVCVISAPELAKSVEIELVTVEDIAGYSYYLESYECIVIKCNVTIDATDFTPVMETVVISGASQKVCVQISIIDDVSLEFEEHFYVEISTADDSIVLSRATAPVSIRNDDSELLLAFYVFNGMILLRCDG